MAMRSLMLCLALLATPPVAAAQESSRVAIDERVVLFPTLASRTENGWRVRLHAWVFEPERDSAWRIQTVDAFGRALGLSEKERASEIFLSRAHPFIADNERGKRIGVTIADCTHLLPSSGANGHAEADVTITDQQALDAASPAHAGWITLHADNVAPTTDEPARAFTGRALLLPDRGLSVISDIDDTLRISEVGDTHRLLLRTFVEPFEAAPGMSELCRSLAARGAAFHYLSASPWQLYEPLARFLEDSGFPQGSFHMRSFRLKDETAAKILHSPRNFKVAHLNSLITACPGRRFVLIGDTSEDDAAIYADTAQRFPDAVVFIAIRKAAEKEGPVERASAALAKIPREKWIVFSQPGEVNIPEFTVP